MKIHLTEFACQQHFNDDKAGTVINDRTSEQFEEELNETIHHLDENLHHWSKPGYAIFCKLVFLDNWTNAKAGTIRITPENEKLLKTGYKYRNKDEVPVLSRWFEGIRTPRADCLCIVLYSRKQLILEDIDIPDDCEYGVVAILGQAHNSEEPMLPITIMRNALGISEGGSGVLFDREAYQRSVDFWSRHATAI